MRARRTCRSLRPAGKRGERAELPIGCYHHRQQRIACAAGCHAEHAGNECARLVDVAQADRIGFGRHAQMPDGDIVTAGGQHAGIRSQRNVVVADDVVGKRGLTDGGVVAAAVVLGQRLAADGGIGVAGLVEQKSIGAVGGVVVARRVACQRRRAAARVVYACHRKIPGLQADEGV